MDPRFRGDDKFGVDDFHRTLLRFRGDDKKRAMGWPGGRFDRAISVAASEAV
jgi:hypothetical protein